MAHQRCWPRTHHQRRHRRHHRLALSAAGPTSIGTLYEAYALGHWSLNVFAIRLRPDTTTPSSNQDDEPAACIRRSGICWPIDSAIEAAFNAAKGQQL